MIATQFCPATRKILEHKRNKIQSVCREHNYVDYLLWYQLKQSWLHGCGSTYIDVWRLPQCWLSAGPLEHVSRPLADLNGFGGDRLPQVLSGKGENLLDAFVRQWTRWLTQTALLTHPLTLGYVQILTFIINHSLCHCHLICILGTGGWVGQNRWGKIWSVCS